MITVGVGNVLSEAAAFKLAWLSAAVCEAISSSFTMLRLYMCVCALLKLCANTSTPSVLLTSFGKGGGR